MRQGRIEISKFNYTFRSTVWSSCNGLVLGYEFRNLHVLYIVNPATKQHFILPPFFRRIPDRSLSGIAYVAASMEYKVFLTYPPENTPWAEFCAILTVGVDNSWRNVCTDHLSLAAKKALDHCPYITEGGFAHWADGTQVLTLNVETEIITETPAPIPQVYGGNQRKYYRSTGSYLSLLIARGKFSWEVWEMKPETGEWTKLPNIDLEAHKGTFKRFTCRDGTILVPVGWLEYPEVVIFGSYGQPRTCIFCNLHTHEIDSVDNLVNPTNSYTLLVHRNSLVWLGGC